jgi:hypothetical protein
MLPKPPCPAPWFWPLLPKQKWLARRRREKPHFERRLTRGSAP